MFRLLQCLVAMLIAARLLVPAEAAVLGGSLWITQLWLAAVILWGWDAFRRRDFRLRWGAVDVAVWSVVLGHLISTLYVLQGNGEARSALNMLWEWVGLGCAFFLIRQLIRTREDAGRLTLLLLSFAVMLGGYGIWQHYVEFPRISRNYERIIQELGQLSGPNAPRDALRLQRELTEMGVPFHPQRRSLWEGRLRSTEPFATFALANTLAGFLAAWLFVLLDWVWLGSKSGFRFSWLGAAKVACIVIVGYCLVLTKSRTAWMGLIFGLLAWGILRGAGSLKLSRRWLLSGAGLVLVVAGFFWIAKLSGGFDWQVISEAPKSLEYRRQYWAGAWEVVRHHPWLGVGPGNFRQHYLHYKLPESSEEIADPHNWVLDLWASGGLLAVCGFGAVLVLAVRTGRRNRRLNESNVSDKGTSLGVSAWEIGAGLSFFLVLLVGWLSAEPFEARLIGLFAGWAAAWAILRRTQIVISPWAGLMAGGLAILVHLLGAGGIEMPAIMQTILLLVILLEGATGEWEPFFSNIAWPKAALAVCGLAIAASVLCWQTAMRPVWYGTLLLTSGHGALLQDNNPQSAAKWYEEAHQADPYAPEPLERLADVHFQNWLRNSSERDFADAVKFSRQAITLDPHSQRIYRQLGLMYFLKAEQMSSPEDATQAVEYLKEAVARYPNSSTLRAELALAFEAAGQKDEAVREATRALDLDQINRNAGHADKILPETTVQALESIQTK